MASANRSSRIGVVMLIKNAIVLIDEKAAGLSVYEAVLASAVSRLRPVSMATLATALGMILLLPDAFFVSMAVTIMGGLAGGVRR